MKILVTGAGGFIGRHLAALLASKGHEILAVDNDLRGSLASIEPNPKVQNVAADVLDASRMNELCEGVEAVYHLAYINGTKFFYSIPDKVLEIGIIGTHNVLKACLKNRVPKFYLASSSEAYQQAATVPTPEEVELKVPDVLNPRYSYGGGKIACELLAVNYLRNSGTQCVIFRPHNVYGPRMGYEHVLPELIKKIYDRSREAGPIPKAKKVTIPILGTGDETRSFIYVSDAARAIESCTVLNARSGIYHVGTMQETPIKELVRSVGAALDLEIEIVPSEGAKGSTPRRCPDTSKIRALGFEPEVPLAEGIRRTVAWYWKDYEKQEVP